MKLFVVSLILITVAFAQNQPDQANANWIVVGNEAQPINPRHKKNIQDAISAAGTAGVVVIPPDYAFPNETFTNPNDILIIDLRRGTWSITGDGANFSGSPSGGSVTGTPSQINVASNVASLASPMVTPGGATISGELDIIGNSAIEFNPENICSFHGKINQNQLCSLNDLLVWNPIGQNGENELILTAQYRDIINNPPPNGWIYAWNSADAKLELQAPTSNVPTGVAKGAALVASGVSLAPTYQVKPVVDVRDYGVVGDGVVDDTTAWQNAINAACLGGAITWPYGSKWKISSTLTVGNCDGISLDGPSSQGQTTGGQNPAQSGMFSWYGSAAGTVLKINQTRDSRFGHFSIDADASNHAAVGANIGLLIDEAGSVTNIVTNNHFDNIQVTNGAANSSFIAIDVCPTAPGNCETQNFDRLFINCANPAPTSNTSNGIGLKYEVAGGAQPNHEYVHWLEATTCSKAVDIEGRFNIDIDGGLMGGNWTDLQVNGGQLISYKNFRSEDVTGAQQIVIGTASASAARDLTIESISFSSLTNGSTTISYPYSNTGGILRLIKNAWDNNSTVIPFGPTGAGAFVGVLDSQDNTYPGTTNCVTAPFATGGVMFSSLNDQPTGGTCNYQGLHLGRARGTLQVDATIFANLNSCAAGSEGTVKAVSDSTTNVVGATITGSGSKHVLGYCNGTNWVVGATDTPIITTANQITSTVSTGTAPFSVASTTPVSNLTVSNHPLVYEAGVLTTAEKFYTNTQALTAGAATHTLANSFTYTSSATFGCTCTDQTAANACKAVPASATTVTLAGTTTDVLWLSCSGH